MKFKAVLFDLDGTLANSLKDLALSTNHVLKKYGFEERPEENFKFYAGDGMAKMIARAMPQERVEDMLQTLLADFLEYYAVHYADNTSPYDGLVELVKKLKESGLKIAVVTNKAQKAAESVVTKLFGDTFDYIMGMRPDIPAKPDPTAVLMVMEELGVKPEECAFVGDTSMDIAAGVNAGAFPVGVLWGFRKREELESAGAKVFANTADELGNILLGD
ncbi:MAG: HAD-IA family hydrolase [Clostridia bacterium]|nr:HAD-IA family hydrolase [Clostridia bacterium]